MLKGNVMYSSGLAPESAGFFKISIWEDDFVIIENHSGIADIKKECIKIYHRKRTFAVSGENLSIKELDGCNLKIKGKIFRTEYLT